MKIKIAFYETYNWITICLVNQFIANSSSINKFCTKNQFTKAIAFVKRIWLPTGSNYLIYSGISPGWARSGPIKVSQLKITNRLADI